MSTKSMPSRFRTLPALFLALMALAGLILCLTVMHSAPAAATVSAAPGSAVALTAHHELLSAQASGVPGEVATCQGPCGQDHFMMAVTCAVALLAPFMLIGAARITSTWRPFGQRMQSFSQRVRAVAPSMPPSLLALSISRT